MRLLSAAFVVVAVLALVILPLTTAALLLSAIAVVCAVLIQPPVGLYLLVFAVPFGSLRSLSFGGFSITATDLLVGLTGAAWLARGVAARRVRPAHAPLALPLVLVILAQMLSLFGALSLASAVKELIKWSEILVTYVVAASIFSESADSDLAGWSNQAPAGDSRTWRLSPVHAVVACILVAGLLEALLGLYQFVTRAGPEYFLIGRFLRSYGTFAQPNPYAGFLNLSLPLGYALLLAGDHSQRGTQRKDVAILVWLAIVGAALLTSLSRGAWLGFAVAFAVISALHSRRMAAAVVLGGGILAMLLILGSANLLPAALTGRFTSAADYFRVFDVRRVKVTDENFAVVERMAHWQAAVAMIEERPALGFGAGNYADAYPSVNLPGWKEPLGHAHNVLLNVTAETGLVGLAAYLAFLACALWTCWRGAQAAGLRVDNAGRAIALGVLGILCAKITHEMLDNLWVHAMGLQVAISLALVFHVERRPGDRLA